jgi:hypothetical protein
MAGKAIKSVLTEEQINVPKFYLSAIPNHTLGAWHINVLLKITNVLSLVGRPNAQIK